MHARTILIHMAALCGLFAQAAADAPRDTTEGSINAPLRDTDLISLPLEFKNLGNPLIRCLLYTYDASDD